MSIHNPTWADHLLVVLILVIIPMYAVLVGQRSMKKHSTEFTTRMRIATYWSNSVFLWLLSGLCVAATVLGGRSLADLGIKQPSNENPGLAVALFLAFLLGFFLDLLYESRPSRMAQTASRFLQSAPFMPVTWREFAHSLVLLLSAGVCEEVIYRGYVIPYLSGWAGADLPGLVLATTLPALAFGFAHLYQGRVAVLKIIALAIVLGALFLSTRSLWLPILLHIFVDVFGALYGMWLVRRARAANVDTQEETQSPVL